MRSTEVFDGEIPILGKMPLQVDDASSLNFDSNVVPRHSRNAVPFKICNAELSWRTHFFKSVVSIVSTWPVIGSVGYTVLTRVPSPISNVKSAHKGNFFINDAHFFMVGPQDGNNDIWMSDYMNSSVLLKVLLHMSGVLKQ